MKRDLFPTLRRLRNQDVDGLVGLEIDADSVAAAQIDETGAARLAAGAVGPLAAGAVNDGEVADQDAVAEALRNLFTTHDLPRKVRLGIGNQRVVVRTLRLPMIENPKELATAVRFAAQEQIPMPIDDAVLDHRVVGGAATAEAATPQLDVVVVAARRAMVAAWLETLRKAGLQPMGIDLSAFGLIRAMGELPEPEGEEAPARPTTSVLYANIGEVTNLAIARGRSCLFTRVSPVGIGDIVSSLGSSTEMAREHSRQWLYYVGLTHPAESLEGDPATVAQTRAVLENGASALLDELRLSLDFYSAQEGAARVERIVLSGPGSILPGLGEWMEPALGLPIEAKLPSALSELDAATAARLTLSYGLALEE
ncbi:MAG TPA: type IV pilus assembly protein PilM [Solirubrobacterales bacterium]|nr:type IV pilus assembly protein PilM [Solirubrobacterales bacterium]